MPLGNRAKQHRHWEGKYPRSKKVERVALTESYRFSEQKMVADFEAVQACTNCRFRRPEYELLSNSNRRRPNYRVGTNQLMIPIQR